MFTPQFSVYECQDRAYKNLLKLGQQSVTIERAIGILRYFDPAPIPYGMNVIELLYSMDERGIVRIATPIEKHSGRTRVFLRP